MAFILRPPGEHRSLAERLRALGRRHGVALAVGRLGWLLAWTVGVIVTAAVLDAVVSLPSFVRATLLGVGISGVIALVVRLLAGQANSPRRTARMIEDRNPEFNDALTTAAELQSRHGDVRHPFHRATLQYAERLSDALNIETVVPASRAAVPYAIVLAFAAVGTLFALTHLALLPTLGLRFSDPYGHHPWPLKTRIECIQHADLIARGDSFPVLFRVAGEIPDQAIIECRVAGKKPDCETVALTLIDDGETIGKAILDPSRVLADFEVRIRAGDAETAWQPVRVMPPPKLIEMPDGPSPRMRLAYPHYTGLEPVVLPGGAASVEAVVGTVITLDALADRPLKAAWLEPKSDMPGLPVAQAVAPLAVFFAPTSLLAESFTANIPVTVTGADRRGLSVRFTVPANGLHALRFTDDNGLTGQSLLDLRLFPDPSPKVTLLRPDPARDTTALLLTASLPLKARAEDPIFGVLSLAFEYRLSAEDWKTLSAAKSTGSSHRRVDQTGLMKLGELRHTDGRPPAAGDRLTLRAIATDDDDISILKSPGISSEIVIELHSPESLSADLDRQLAALRQPLARIIETQKTAEAKWKDAATSTGEAERREAFAAVDQAQNAVRKALAEPGDGLRAQVRRLQQTAAENRLTKSATTTRLDAVAKTLERVEDKHLGALERKLDDARRNPDAKPDRDGIARHQKAVREELAAADAELERWAGAAELRGDLQNLKKSTARLERDAASLEQRLPAGQPRDQLPAADQKSLDQLSAEQTALAESLAKFRDKAGKVLEARKAGGATANADTVAIERAAASEAGRDATDKLRSAAESTKANRLSDAAIARTEAGKKLDTLEAELKPQTPAADELTKARKSAAKEIDTLKADQNELTKIAKSAKNDPAATAKLAEEQETLQRKTEQLADRLDGSGKDGAAESLRKAAEAMDQSAEALSKGEALKADEALQKLDDAKKKLETPDTKPEELAREPQEDMAKAFKAFLERQKAAVAEYERLIAVARKEQRWDRPLIASLIALAGQEASLAKEFDAFSGKSLAEAPVFKMMLEQAATKMTVAEGKLKDRKDDALTATRYDDTTERAMDAACLKPMKEALRRLEQMASALEQSKTPPKPMDVEPNANDKVPTAAKPQAKPTLPALAQLKALRDWQAELNAATKAFAIAHPDAAKLTDDERSELVELQKSQQAIAKLFGLLQDQLKSQQEEAP